MKATPVTAAGVEASGLRKSLGKVRSLDGVDLHIRPGAATMIDMLLGLSDPYSGDISIYGSTLRAAIARGQVSAAMRKGVVLGSSTDVALLDVDTPGLDGIVAAAAVRAVGGCRASVPSPRRLRAGGAYPPAHFPTASRRRRGAPAHPIRRRTLPWLPAPCPPSRHREHRPPGRGWPCDGPSADRG